MAIMRIKKEPDGGKLGRREGRSNKQTEAGVNGPKGYKVSF